MSSRTGPSTRRRSAAAVGVGALLGAAAAMLAAPSAQAHTALVSSSPCDGAVVASVPTEITFTFDESPASPAAVSVIGPDRSNIADGAPVVDGATVTQTVRLLPEQGKYSASYRVVSDDGHPVTGTIHFTVDPANAADGATDTACVGSSYVAVASTAFWDRESTWIVIALAALVIGLVLVLAIGISSTTSSNAGEER
jgi:copper resistance protein C